MIKQLIKLANHLDKKGLAKEADYLDAVIRKIAEEMSDEERKKLTPPPDDLNKGDFLPKEVRDKINEEAEE